MEEKKKEKKRAKRSALQVGPSGDLAPNQTKNDPGGRRLDNAACRMTCHLNHFCIEAIVLHEEGSILPLVLLF